MKQLAGTKVYISYDISIIRISLFQGMSILRKWFFPIVQNVIYYEYHNPSQNKNEN
jgi:hypothetical protein